MKTTKAQRVCRNCFLIVLALSLILLFVLPAVTLHIERNDSHKFMDGIWALVAFIGLLIVVFHEVIAYVCLRYFLGNRKRRWKSVFFTSLFVIDLIALGVEIVNFVSSVLF